MGFNSGLKGLIHLLADSVRSSAVADCYKADSTKGLQLYADV
jgi:hypothetical protein